MKKLIDYVRISKFLYLLIILKRILFIVRKNLKHIRKSIEWLCTSKEHTNFSLKLDYRNKKSMCLYLENSFNIDKLKIEELIQWTGSLEFYSASFTWWRRHYIIAALALDRSAYRRSGRGWKPTKYSEKPSEPERWSLSSLLVALVSSIGGNRL